MNTTDVENFPGFPDGIMGPDLMDNLRKQAERFGAELVTDDVTAVDLTGDVKVVTDGSGVEHRARTVIIATGSGYRELGLPDEKRLSGRGVSWCATCDGFFFRDQDIAVVGGGDTAMEEATFLTRFARSVTIVHRRDTPARLQDHAGARVRQREDPLRLGQRGRRRPRRDQGRPASGCATCRPARSRRSTSPACSSPSATTRAASCSTARCDRDDEGYVLVERPSTRTNLAGVFACGDVVDHTYRQAITAAGTGCAAALDAERYLAALEDASMTGDPVQAPRPASSEPAQRPHAEHATARLNRTTRTAREELLWEPRP